MKGPLICLLIFIYSLGKAQFISKTTKLEDWQISFKEKEVKSVMDYYLLLPNSIFECEIDRSFNEHQRLELISIKDIKNGFIAFKSTYQFSMALFRDRKNNLDYLAISSNDSGRGSTCGGLNAILRFTQDKGWIYSTDVLPAEELIYQQIKEFYKDSDEVSYYYKVPRYGLTMTINDDSTDEIICKLQWKTDKFEIIK